MIVRALPHMCVWGHTLAAQASHRAAPRAAHLTAGSRQAGACAGRRRRRRRCRCRRRLSVRALAPRRPSEH
eukprot:351357-Chlamydomonas_euryale.AAC.2